MPCLAHAEDVLSDKDALAAFRARNPALKALAAELEAAQAERRGGRLYPNPELEWSRERVNAGGGASTEQSLTLALPLSISGRYGLTRRSADLGFKEQKGLVERRIFELENELSLSFYASLWAQEQARALREGLGRMRSLAQAIQGRGGADVQDQLRLAIEVSEAEAALEESELHRLETDAALRQLLGVSTEPVKLSGALPPEGDLPRFESFSAKADSRSDLSALEWRRLKQDVLRRSAERAWIPSLKVAAGRKSIDEPGRSGSGLVTGLSLELPIFNRGQALAAAEKARQKGAAARGEELRLEIAAFLRTQHEIAAKRRALAQRYEQTAFRQAERLERTVGTSYLEGRRTLLEILDAYRASLAVRLRTLELAFEAKKADLLLERLSGARLEDLR
ncbi:MAG: TolC family protein [Elusimicrobia bacterium]|nr:TolC family protein [Elusimicrobiota bacterium]